MLANLPERSLESSLNRKEMKAEGSWTSERKKNTGGSKIRGKYNRL